MAEKAVRSRGLSKARVVAAHELTPEPVVLVLGGEELLAERAIAAVTAAARAADAELQVHHLEAAGYETGQLALLASPSLFGGGALVVVEGVDAANDALVTDATAYLRDPAAEVCLVLRHKGGNRAKPLLDAARAVGAPEVVCAPITKDEEKLDFVAGEFARLRRRASPQAVRALVDAVGSDLRELAAACRHLASDAGDGDPTGNDGARIEVDLVEQLFGGRVEVTGFRVADATIAGHSGQALALLRHALATGADPVPLVAAVAAKVRVMAKVAAAGRGRSADVAVALGVAPWQVDKARRELQGWTDRGLGEALLALAEADTAVKGGGRDPVYAVEKALLTITAARTGR